MDVAAEPPGVAVRIETLAERFEARVERVVHFNGAKGASDPLGMHFELALAPRRDVLRRWSREGGGGLWSRGGAGGRQQEKGRSENKEAKHIGGCCSEGWERPQTISRLLAAFFQRKRTRTCVAPAAIGQIGPGWNMRGTLSVVVGITIVVPGSVAGQDGSPYDPCVERGDSIRGSPRRTDDAASPCPRSRRELYELYGHAALFGLFSAGLIQAELDLEGDPNDGVNFAIATGTIAASIGVAYLVDEQASPLPEGVPATISTGMELGLFEGLFGWPAFGGALLDEESAGISWLTTLLGAGVGGIVGARARPTVDDNAWIRSGGLWGTALFAMIARATSLDDEEDRARMWFTGLNVGVLSAVFITTVARPTRLQSLYMDLGGIAGLLSSGVLVAGSDDDEQIATALGIGTLSGLILGIVVAPSDDDADDPAPAPAVRTGVAPVTGGAVAQWTVGF